MTSTPPEPGEQQPPSGYGPPPESPPPPSAGAAGYLPPPGDFTPPSGGYPPPPSGYPPSPAPGYGTPGYPQPYGLGPDPQAKSKVVAGILGILLGGFGVHRFYLGYTKIGVIQIVVTVFTCGLGAIWGFVEGILYLVGASGYTTDATGRPLKD